MKSSINPRVFHASARIQRFPWLLGCWLALCSPARGAVEYELRGVARDEPRALDIHFEVCVRDCRWRIRCWHSDGAGLRFDTALLSPQELIRVTESSTQRWATAVIESGAIPAGCEESATSLLWLFLASGCSWDSAGTGRLTPVYDSLASAVLDRDRRQLAFWELLPGPPYLPLRVAYVSEGQRRVWDSRTGRGRLVALPPPYDRGYTNAVATVLELATAKGLTVPRRFRFEQYATGSTNAGSTLRSARRFEGRVDQVRWGCSHADLVPRPPFRTAVQDRRLGVEETAGLVTYAVSAGRWPDMEQLRKIHKRQQRAAGSLGVWQIVLFCVVALAPLVTVFWRRARSGGEARS